jgi:ADP-L-glycero-D-manno-heptose 6-epimerase
MIVVTGAAGFIGSCMVGKLNELGYFDLILVDDFSRSEKNRNLENKKFRAQVPRGKFIGWLEKYAAEVEAVIHLGARTDTTLNFHFSQAIWIFCSGYEIPFLYASSAATYGAGELGYDDNPLIINELRPLNVYGWSKQKFDCWVLEQSSAPPFWAGFKFFNVYGPNEYHKNRMASVIFHTVRKIKSTGKMELFRSHRPDILDGEQRRDFIFVEDVVDVLIYFLEKKPKNGIFNLGTGHARTFLELAENTFRAMNLPSKISFIDIPEDIRENYQYFTEAKMERLRDAGYQKPFFSLEDGISKYVKNWLLEERIW